MSRPLAVVKVGGSLYDLPDLGSRLSGWLAECCAGMSVILVPGGGPTVDAVRLLDHLHALGEETSHWLALRALTLNAHFLASLLPSSRVVKTVDDWDKRYLAILNVYEFARVDERQGGHLPHCWSVTSDAFAARAAVVFDADALLLLKSTTIPAGTDWQEAGRRGWVDERFAEVLRDAPANLQVSAVNLRMWSG